MTRLDAAHIADELWRVRRTGDVVPPLPADLSETEAYVIQDALIAARSDSPSGWKVGATACGAPGKLGLSEPMAGPLWIEYIHHTHSNPSIRTWPAHRSQAEVELAFRFGSAPRSNEWQSIASAIDGIAMAIELTGWRFADMASPPGPHFVADHATNAFVICGEFRSEWRDIDLSKLEAHLLIDGVPAAHGKSEAVMGNPRNSVTWLCKHLSQRGHRVVSGQIVLSGAIVPVTSFSPDVWLSAKCEPFEPFDVQILEAR